jgi:hypothetical protein
MTKPVIQNFCTNLYIVFHMTLLIGDISHKTYIAFSSTTGTLEKVFQINSCSTEYISHMHCLPAVYESEDAQMFCLALSSLYQNP